MGGSGNRKTPRPERARSRPSVRGSGLLALARALTDRDRMLLEDLFEHRVLTVHQIQELYFSSGPVTRRRMVRLFRLRVVDRFQPLVPGSAPFHYVLDNFGARIVAAQRGIGLRDLGFRKEQVEELPYRQELRHLVGTNGFFVRLIGACRSDGDHRVSEWWSERRCRRRWGELVSPDGHGKVEHPDGGLSFLVEYDRGTEGPGRLAAKLASYERVCLLSERPDAVLFCFPDSKREVSARRRLHGLPGMVVATASWDRFGSDPLGPVWLPMGSERRLPLLHLRRWMPQEPP